MKRTFKILVSLCIAGYFQLHCKDIDILSNILQNSDMLSEQLTSSPENFFTLVKTLTRLEQSELYGATQTHSAKPNTHVTISGQSLKELNFEALIKKIDRTHTAAGMIEFKKLMRPLSNQKELAMRQALIKKFIEDEELFTTLDTLVKSFAQQHEKTFIHTLKPLELNDPVKQAQDKMLWLFTFGSTKAKLLQMTALLASMGSDVGYEAIHLRDDIRQMPGAGLLKTLSMDFNWYNRINGLYQGIKGMSSSMQGIISLIPQTDAFCLDLAHGIASGIFIGTVLAKGDPIIAQSEIVKNFADIVPKRSSPFFGIIQKLIQRLETELTEPSDNQPEGPLSSAAHYWTMADSLDLYFNIRLAGIDGTNLEQKLFIFEPIIHAFGVLDAYLSVVRLYREWISKDVPVCYAEYESSQKTKHNFVELYNPLLSSSVPNDFALGDLHQPRHALLTGPHACGKTMSMKTLAYGYLLGQTITIVPALSAEFTPITHLQTYFNIGDDLSLGLSSFTAEDQRLTSLIKAAKKLKTGKRCLMLVDEPLAKTIQIMGEPLVTQFAQDIVSQEKVTLVMATHFEDPTKLEAQTNGIIKNYQPELQQIDAQTFKRTFKIVEGKADWWFNDSEKRDAFIDWLIRQ